MPTPTLHKGKTLLNHIDSDYKKKIESEREFKMPPYRTGDAVELTMFNSLSEGTYNVINGIIFGHKKRNNLRSSIRLRTVVDSVQTSIMIKTFSPMVAKVEMVKYGSNQLRKNMMHVHETNLSKNRLKESITRGKGYKHRLDIGKKKRDRSSSGLSKRGQAVRGSVDLDSAENYEDLE